MERMKFGKHKVSNLGTYSGYLKLNDSDNFRKVGGIAPCSIEMFESG
jgi:hypothetical protein